MSNTPLAHDLALKRTVHAPTEQKPIYAWRDVITNVEINLPPIVLLCPHGEERFDMAEVADTLGKALTNVFISQGEKDIFTDKNRAWVAQICRELGGNLTEMARKQNPLRLTLNALYELIEKTLVDNNAYMVAKSLLLNRSRKLSVSRESAAQSSVRVIRRNGHVVPWNDHKVEIAVRKTFLSLASGFGAGGRDLQVGVRPRQCLKPGLCQDRGGPGHRPGGAHEGRPLQGGGGLHPVPGGARRGARGGGLGRGGRGAGRADGEPGDARGRQEAERGDGPLGGGRPAQADRVCA